ncbi:MAG TPA: hypothetical protein VGW38_22635 [Chloroflexota bacterium]|nr:hypothetical protein [Chloroflexota bacterium]
MDKGTDRRLRRLEATAAQQQAASHRPGTFRYWWDSLTDAQRTSHAEAANRETMERVYRICERMTAEGVQPQASAEEVAQVVEEMRRGIREIIEG